MVSEDEKNEQAAKVQRSQDKLKKYVEKYKIFVDTCSLLEPQAEIFWENIVPLLQTYQKHVIVPQKCIEELEKHKADLTNLNRSKASQRSLENIKRLVAAKYVQIRGEASDNFPDNVFLTVFTQFRVKESLLLITQDNDLAQDVLKLNETKSVRGNPVAVQKINKYGFLSAFNMNNKNNKPGEETPDSHSVHNGSRDINPFRSCNTVTSLDDAELPVSHIPVEGELILTPQGEEVQLRKALASGGEGTIYETNTNYVAKIYRNHNNTRRKQEKIKLMLSKPLQCEGVCYPVAPLYNLSNEFVGFLMPQAKGKELQKSIFIKQLLVKNFPDWKKRDTVELCITILEKIIYLHDRNIIIGDINPSNILVVSPKEVYFVDTDSYQIEDFPCPVGTVNYTAPEIQRKHFPDFLRTMGNENFAVATLLFMIMLPGKPPYSQQGGDAPMTNIINMDFSYPLGDNSNGKTPDGSWRYIWSHLTYKLKEAFYNTFRKGGMYSTESTRLSARDWISIFSEYLQLLDSGSLAKTDPMSEELFPNRYKKSAQLQYITCILCRKEVPENHCQDSICPDCLYNKGVVRSCKKCGKQFLISNYDIYIKKVNTSYYGICSECRDYGKKTHCFLTCVDCGKEFPITNSEYDSFTEKGWELPKRCKDCRNERKNCSNSMYRASECRSTQSNHQSMSSPYSFYSTQYRSTPHEYRPSSKGTSTNRKKGSFCFLTTVLCEYYGKPDDCIELNTMRRYRDDWLQNQPGGPELVEEYYDIAPSIVEKLKTSDRYDFYCQYLWKNYMRPCLDLIEVKDYESCKIIYIEMVRYLQAELGETVP